MRSRVSAKPTILTLRWWSETAGCAMKGQKGNRDRRLCSPTAECQTKLVLGVRSAIFPRSEMERQRNVAVGKWPCSRIIADVLAVAKPCGPIGRHRLHPPAREQRLVGYCFWPDGVLRPYCYLADMRSIAAFPHRLSAASRSRLLDIRRTRSVARVRRREPVAAPPAIYPGCAAGFAGLGSL